MGWWHVTAVDADVLREGATLCLVDERCGRRSRLYSRDNRALSPCRGGLNQFLDVKTKSADLETVRSESSILLFSNMNAQIGKRAHYQAEQARMHRLKSRFCLRHKLLRHKVYLNYSGSALLATSICCHRLQKPHDSSIVPPGVVTRTLSARLSTSYNQALLILPRRSVIDTRHSPVAPAPTTPFCLALLSLFHSRHLFFFFTPLSNDYLAPKSPLDPPVALPRLARNCGVSGSVTCSPSQHYCGLVASFPSNNHSARPSK